MTVAALALCLLLGFSAFSSLALSLDRHHRAAFRTPVPKRRAGGLRAAGWAGLALSFAAAVAAGGWNFGPVQWIGSLTGSALLTLAYRQNLIDSGTVWTAAHVDEDHNVRLWGEDDEATRRRAQRFVEFSAAVDMLGALA